MREYVRRNVSLVLLEVVEESVCVIEQIIEVLSNVLHLNCPLSTVIFLIFEGLIVLVLPFEYTVCYIFQLSHCSDAAEANHLLEMLDKPVNE